jgi:hypothetical protein
MASKAEKEKTWRSVVARNHLLLLKVQTYLRPLKKIQILCLTYRLRSEFTFHPLHPFNFYGMSPSPLNEWQDRVVTMINGLPPTLPPPPKDYNSPKSEVSEGNLSHTSTGRRQRRRVGTEGHPLRTALEGPNPTSESLHESHSGTTSWYNTPSKAWGLPLSGSADKIKRSLSIDCEAVESDSEEELLSAVGQLSINEDEQIRYHGKASGIYLLRNKERLDQRNEGDIWLVFDLAFSNIQYRNLICRRFPKARVWPRLPSRSPSLEESSVGVELPPKGVQEHLLDLYFTYVHPYLPIIHKQSFMDAFRDGCVLTSVYNRCTS